jgi:hypothetical protein
LTRNSTIPRGGLDGELLQAGHGLAAGDIATPLRLNFSQAVSMASLARVGLGGGVVHAAWKRKPTGPTTLVTTMASHFWTYSSSLDSLRLRARTASRLRWMSLLALPLTVDQPWVRRLTWAAA